MADNIDKIIKLQALWKGYCIRKVYWKYRDNNRNTKYFTYEEQIETLSKTKPYVGLSSTGKREKRPVYTFKSGATYDGEWRGGMRDGYGKITWPD